MYVHTRRNPLISATSKIIDFTKLNISTTRKIIQMLNDKLNYCNPKDHVWFQQTTYQRKPKNYHDVGQKINALKYQELSIHLITKLNAFSYKKSIWAHHSNIGRKIHFL